MPSHEGGGEGATSQGTQVPLESGKVKFFFLKPPEITQPCQYPDFSPVDGFRTSDLQKFKRMNLYL